MNFSCCLTSQPLRSFTSQKNMLMRRYLSLLIAAAVTVSFATFSSAQSAFTDPVGFETLTIGSGKIGGVSLPLDNIPAFSGPVSSRTANSITTTNAAFGSLSTAASPYLIRILSGASVGRQFRITANTTDTLTLNTGGADLTTLIAVGDRYSVHAIQTLASFFGADASDPNKPAINRNADSTLADNVLIRGAFGYLTYYNDGTKWQLVGGGTTVQNDVVLLPDQGFLLSRRPSNPLTITVTGAVPTTDLKTDLPANKITIFPNRFPVGTTLAGLNLNAVPAWIENDDASLADNILIRGTFGWSTYYLNSAGSWRLFGGGNAVQDTTAIPLGTSVLAVRRVGTNITLNQTRPYTLP